VPRGVKNVGFGFQHPITDIMMLLNEFSLQTDAD
jgi:hypothetical protein